MHLAIHLCSISCSSCVIWSSKYSWRVLYQNLFGRMCSLLHYLQLVTQVLKKFLCYLKLDNFSSVLLLFPLLTFFLSSFSSLLISHSPEFYCWDPTRWLSYRSVLYPYQAMFSIRQDVFTRRLLIYSVQLVFQFLSSNSFVVNILFSVFNILFKI